MSGPTTDIPANSSGNDKISITQTISISIAVTSTLEIEGGGNLTQAQIDAITQNNAIDVSSIVLSMLGGFNPANLGITNVNDSLTVSGNTFLNNLDSTAVNTGLMVVDDQLIIGDNTSALSLISKVDSLDLKVSTMESSLNLLFTNKTDISFSNNLLQSLNTLASSLQELEISFNNLSSNIHTNISVNVFNSYLSFANVEVYEIHSNNNTVLILNLVTDNKGSIVFPNSLLGKNILVKVFGGSYSIDENNDFKNVLTNIFFNLSFNEYVVNPLTTLTTSNAIGNNNKILLNENELNNQINIISNIIGISNEIINEDYLQKGNIEAAKMSAKISILSNLLKDISNTNINNNVSLINRKITDSIINNFSSTNNPIIFNTNEINTIFTSIESDAELNISSSDTQFVKSNFDKLTTRLDTLELSNNTVSDIIKVNYIVSISSETLVNQDVDISDIVSTTNLNVITNNVLQSSIPDPSPVPSKPIFNSETFNLQNIILNYSVNSVNKLVIDNNNTLAKYNLIYNEIDTTRSSAYPLINNDLESTETISDSSNNFNINLNNLKYGTKYNYKVRVSNDLSANLYSIFSNVKEGESFTAIPQSNNTNTSINFNITNTTKNIRYIDTNTNTIKPENNVIYIDLSDSNNILQFSNNSLQSFELTYPHANINSFTGYGKFIENEELSIIKIYTNDLSMQTIIFDGSFSNSNVNNINHFNTFTFITDINKNDMFANNNENKKGFRLQGGLKLNDLNQQNIIDVFNNNNAPIKTLTFEYNRDINVNQTTSQPLTIYKIVLDNFGLEPEISSSSSNYTNDILVSNVIYNMGIPSIKKFQLRFVRQYDNIQSGAGYFRSDKKIVQFNFANNNISLNTQTIILTDNDLINDLREKTFYKRVATPIVYNNVYYNNESLSPGNTINWNEEVFNIKTSKSSNIISLLANHYCDYNSFITSNGEITSSKLNLSNLELYEISNISLLGTDIGNIQTISYEDHNNIVKDHTLLYINGKFQANNSITYPNVNDFSYNPIVTIPNSYNARNKQYDLSGIDTTSNIGYKWIVFKIKKNNGGTKYIFNGLSYDIETSENRKYISIKSMLNGLFTPNAIDLLFDENSMDVIGFIKVTNTSNYIRMGNIKTDYSPVGANWKTNGNVNNNSSYNSSLNSSDYDIAKKYGCKIINDTNNDKGIYIGITDDIEDDLELFIGLKNN